MKRGRQEDFTEVYEEKEGEGGDANGYTKAERNIARQKANKKWKLVDRKIGSGIDPNPRHTLYYKAQLPELNVDVEWTRFQASLVKPLPVTFRFSGYCPDIVKIGLRKQFLTKYKTMMGRFVEIDGVVLRDDIVTTVEWPGPDVFQIAADSITLSKNEGLEPLSTALFREVNLGHVVRQELASMIPALLLGVKEDHKILDLCAAPGSKTEQLLDLMNKNAYEIGKAASGMVVANDPDPDRILTLKRRYEKCLSPNFLVTCATAEDLARRVHRCGASFDRVLADVPCSGDGTIRKFPHIWRVFRPRMAIELHKIQLAIALSGLQMLHKGGRMVYSTCSINPLEDEAVVAELLRRHWSDGLRLVDTRSLGLLPLLQSRPGVSSWHCDESIFLLGEPKVNHEETLRRIPKLVESMRAPSRDEADLFHLDRCHRILPQDNDTGGFFVAVLEFSDHRAGEKNIPCSSSSVFHYDSVEVMKQLGYNPKRLPKKGNLKKLEGEKGKKRNQQDPLPTSYACCDNIYTKHIFDWLEVERRTINYNALVSRHTQLGEEVSLVSNSLQDALTTWANEESRGFVSDGYSLIHAGVPLVYNTGMKTSTEFALAPYCSHVITPIVRKQNICPIGKEDFLLFASLRISTEDRDPTDEINSVIASPGSSVTDSLRNSLSFSGRNSMRETILTICRSDIRPLLFHIHVICHHQENSGIIEGGGVKNNNDSKKRLSKAERKAIKKGSSRQPVLEAKANNNAVDSLNNQHGESDATLVFRCEYEYRGRDEKVESEKILSSLKFSFVTSVDVCQSYIEAISTC